MEDVIRDAEFVNNLNKLFAKFKKAGLNGAYAAVSVEAVMQKHYPADAPARRASS